MAFISASISSLKHKAQEVAAQVKDLPSPPSAEYRRPEMSHPEDIAQLQQDFTSLRRNAEAALLVYPPCTALLEAAKAAGSSIKATPKRPISRKDPDGGKRATEFNTQRQRMKNLAERFLAHTECVQEKRLQFEQQTDAVQANGKMTQESIKKSSVKKVLQAAQMRPSLTSLYEQHEGLQRGIGKQIYSSGVAHPTNGTPINDQMAQNHLLNLSERIVTASKVSILKGRIKSHSSQISRYKAGNLLQIQEDIETLKATSPLAMQLAGNLHQKNYQRAVDSVANGLYKNLSHITLLASFMPHEHVTIQHFRERANELAKVDPARAQTLRDSLERLLPKKGASSDASSS